MSADQEFASDVLATDLQQYVNRSVARMGGATNAVKPSHRVKFHWPPHPVSHDFHVLTSDWRETTTMEAYGEVFLVEVARTPNGVFGRAKAIWHEDRGDTDEEMLANLRESSKPLFKRQWSISRALELDGRFTGKIAFLEPIELLKLLYCEDRDVATEARTQIEKHASEHRFLPALLVILSDETHPYRRSAQWCVLDLFEDLHSFCHEPGDEEAAVETMKQLIWSATDDYARTIYKAGVVLGGHVPGEWGGPALIECLAAPSKIGRRAAIHGLYHVVEWNPESMEPVTTALREHAKSEPEAILAEYALDLAVDIERADTEHVPDPIFPEE